MRFCRLEIGNLALEHNLCRTGTEASRINKVDCTVFVHSLFLYIFFLLDIPKERKDVDAVAVLLAEKQHMLDLLCYAAYCAVALDHKHGFA